MGILFFVLAILILCVAHLCKVYRWKQFIKIYEKPKDNILVRSLALGYLVNYIFPYRIGEFFRAFYSGRKMKNGVSFSLATIIVDRILDIMAVGFIFLLIYLFGFNASIVESMQFYIAIAILLVILMFVALKFNRYIKIGVKKVAGIFNSNIELKILKFTWSIITSFKDIIYKINKIRLLLSTILMWGLYMLSYGLFAFGLRNCGYEARLLDVFMSLFAKNSLDVSTINLVNAFGREFLLVTVSYMVVPLILLVVISIFIKNKNEKSLSQENHNYLELLPHADANDRLLFLEAYFSGNSREYFKKYLQINRNISVIQDFSAGSNATTMLCSDNSKTFFRKYSFGKDSEKLYEQIKWLEKHSDNLPVTSILKQNKSEDSCYYDMPYIKDSVSCFNFVHSEDIEKSWKILQKVLDDLDSKLHTLNVRKADNKLIKKYIDEKIFENIKKLEDSKYIKEILKYDELIINGKKYKNINQFEKYLNYDYLYNLFKKDMYSDIHGDMTIENIICLRNYNDDKDEDYYIIDPNTGNVHDSPCLDYGKLLQSLHGGYEFLMNTKSVEVNQNTINYLSTKSHVYSELFEKYKQYLEQKFDKQKVKSIFFHEIVHWLRLLPYKIKKDGQRAVLFYAGFIIVLNEVIKFYGGDNNEK